MIYVNDFRIEDDVLMAYTGADSCVTVPDGVTRIAENAFYDNYNLRRVTLPDSVTRIGRRAFFGCGSLAEIRLPKGLRRIEALTFAFCGELRKVEFPAGLNSIGISAFFRCEQLDGVVLPEGLLEIEYEAFSHSGITNIAFPQGLLRIGEEAFSECTWLRRLIFPQPDTIRIGSAAFRGCDKLTDEDGLLILHDRLFCFKPNAKNRGVLVLPDGVRRIDNGAVQGGVHRIEMPLACPEWNTGVHTWRGDTYDSILTEHGSELVLREPDGSVAARVLLLFEGESAAKARMARMAIRQQDGRFDFEEYDRVFSVLGKKENRLRMALVRMEYPYSLSAETEKTYRLFLRRNIGEAGRILLEQQKTDLLMRLCDLTRPGASGFQALIALAQAHGAHELTAWLLDRKRAVCGAQEAPQLRIPPPPKSPYCLTVTEAFGRFRTRSDTTGCTVTAYIGDAPEAVLPEKIGTRHVTGLGEYAFSNRCPAPLTRITVPGWYTRFDGPCFSFLSDVTVEFREGVVSLPPNLFLVANRVTVRLPRSLQSLGDQRLNDPKYGSAHNRYLVPGGSAAERICRENGWHFEIYDTPPDALDARGPEVLAELSARREKAAWKAPKPGSFAAGRYQGAERRVTFPETIGGVPIQGAADTGGKPPENYTLLTEVTLPEGYTFIGKQAFAGCASLETVRLPSSLREIRGRAFAGCVSLKTLHLGREVFVSGKNTFDGAGIDTVILETAADATLPAGLFYGCRIRRLVVLGGRLRSAGCLFADPARCGGDLNFPQEIYMNGRFGARDLFGRGGAFLDRLHPLAAFDESTLEDASLRALVAEEKALPGVLFDHRTLLAQPDPPPGEILFPVSQFVFYDRYDENYPDEFKVLYGGVTHLGGKVSRLVTAHTTHLILPDGPAIDNTAVKTALRLRRAGCNITLVRRSDLRRVLDRKLN